MVIPSYTSAVKTAVSIPDDVFVRADAVEGRPNPRLERFRWREPVARRRESARAGEP